MKRIIFRTVGTLVASGSLVTVVASTALAAGRASGRA
jgi:hypothetical protein